MYRKLKAAHRGYPIKMLLGDFGHGAQNQAQQVTYEWDQITAFIDTHLGSGTVTPPVAASFPTLCAPTTGPKVPTSSDSWDTLVREHPLTFSSSTNPARTTTSSSSDLQEEMASDPQSVQGACIVAACGQVCLWRVLEVGGGRRFHDARPSACDAPLRDERGGRHRRREAVGCRTGPARPAADQAAW